MLSEWKGRVKSKNWLAPPGWDEPWKDPGSSWIRAK